MSSTTIIKAIPSAPPMLAATTPESMALPPHTQPIIAPAAMQVPLNATIPPKSHNPTPAPSSNHHSQNQNQRANIETSLGPDGIHLMIVTFSPCATECTEDDLSPKLPPPNKNWGLKLRILAQNPVTHATWDGDSYHAAMDAVSNVIAKFKQTCWDSLAEFDIECP